MSLVNKKGVDIGDHNGDVSFAALKKAGMAFVMLKCGIGSDYTSQDDSQFEANVRKAEAAGLPWGAWLYSYALNAEQARSELAHILRLLKGKKPTMPIALDVEDSDNYRKNHGGWNFSNVNSCTKIVLEGLAEAGYYPMLYTGFEEIENYISPAVYEKYDMWFAHWASKCGYKGRNLGIWQYGGETNVLENNSIPGVGVVDKDICYKDYPTIIKNGGYNGWAKGSADAPTETEPTATADVPTVATVQKWLNDNYNAGLAVDSIYGRLTKAALVRALQTELNRQAGANLAVDGIFGSKTASAIFNIKSGMQGNLTRILQALLLCNGYPSGGFDGIFGAGTESAVREYQYHHALEVDGIAGKQTFERLCNG